jgi:hypothetical protein
MEKKTMDPVKAYLRRRSAIAEHVHRKTRIGLKRSYVIADEHLAKCHRREEERLKDAPAHWSAPTNAPDWYAEQWHDVYAGYLADGFEPEEIRLWMIEDSILKRRNTLRHRQKLRLAVLAALWRNRQAADDDDRAPIVDRVILYEEAVLNGVELDDVNEALQLMAIDRKTRKEQNRLAYIVRRMRGRRSAKVGC